MNEYESYGKDKEIERLNKDIARLEELLSTSETQYASVEQIVKSLQDENKKLKEQIDEANKTTQDLELIIKRIKRRSICEKQKSKARKEHINELISRGAELKEEIANRGRLINELKSQRKEANEIIKVLYKESGNPIGIEYLEKWGVK